MSNDEQITKVDSFINKVSIWIWIYLFIFILLSIYPIYYAITKQICTAMISKDAVYNLTERFQVITYIVVSYLIYPVILLVAVGIPLFFIKKRENLKMYLILSAIFLVSFLISFIICLFKLVIIPLK